MKPLASPDRILLFDAAGRFMAGDVEGSESGTPIAMLGDLIGEEEAARFLTERTDAKPLATAHGDVALRWLAGEAGPVILAAVSGSCTESIRHRDALTGLPDRREIATWFAARERHRSGPSRPYAVLFLDLDNFKAVNDQHGHAAGDAVLVELARRWSAAIRDGDLVVRYGGDEFVVLLENAADVSATQPVVERLRRTTQESIDLNGTPVSLQVTIGVAIGAGDKPIEQRILAADAAMYAQKRQRLK